MKRNDLFATILSFLIVTAVVIMGVFIGCSEDGDSNQYVPDKYQDTAAPTNPRPLDPPTPPNVASVEDRDCPEWYLRDGCHYEAIDFSSGGKTVWGLRHVDESCPNDHEGWPNDSTRQD